MFRSHPLACRPSARMATAAVAGLLAASPLSAQPAGDPVQGRRIAERV